MLRVGLKVNKVNCVVINNLFDISVDLIQEIGVGIDPSYQFILKSSLDCA